MTRRTLAAVCVLLAACGTTPDTQHTGTPRIERSPDVVVHDFTPAPTTTTTTQPTTTTHYHPPTTTTTVADVAVLSSSTPVPYSSIEQVIADAFGRFGSGVVDQAIRVARCESELNPRAYNPSGASGLFQVMPLWADDYQAVTGQPYYDGRFNAWANATFAAWLYGQSGTWRHWSCRGAA